MEETCNTCEVLFNILDFKENNQYNIIKFETLMKEPIKIENKKINIQLNLNENIIFAGHFNENIYLFSSNVKVPEKKFVCTIFCSIDNIINLNINEDGDCSLEITSMWDVNYEDSNSLEERIIEDIKYNGVIIANFEKLYERNTYQEVIAFLKKLVFYNQLNVIMFIYFQNKF